MVSRLLSIPISLVVLFLLVGCAEKHYTDAASIKELRLDSSNVSMDGNNITIEFDDEVV